LKLENNNIIRQKSCKDSKLNPKHSKLGALLCEKTLFFPLFRAKTTLNCSESDTFVLPKMGMKWTKPHVAEKMTARGTKKPTRGTNKNYVWHERKLHVAKIKRRGVFLLKGERVENQ